MNRKDWLKTTGMAGGGLYLAGLVKGIHFPAIMPSDEMTRADFGRDFKWGVAAASYQTEGAWNIDGKGESNWDHFTHRKGRVERGENGDIAADFYHRYNEDIRLIKSMNFKIFRFSLSWPRIIPGGDGEVNRKGLDFYHRVIDRCLEEGIEPWITIYHWDLPQVLEAQGGWSNRKIIDWFSLYTDVVTREYGSKVKNWMVMNEQLSFTGNGYMEGHFAPGRKSLKAFMRAVHYSVLANAEGGRIVRRNIPDANIGTTFANTWVEAADSSEKNVAAAARVDAVMNRLFLEPCLGLGYPVDKLPILKKLYSLYEAGDEEKMAFDFDFLGVQYYFRTIVRNSVIPGMRAKEIPPSERGAVSNEMEGEIYPEGFYQILKKYGSYNGIRNLIVTENGTCVPDRLENGKVHDELRIQYFRDHLAELLKAKQEGVNVNGYFVWSPTDNFEWDKGYRTRFGLVYVDFSTLQRYIKDSGIWFMNFLKE